MRRLAPLVLVLALIAAACDEAAPEKSTTLPPAPTTTTTAPVTTTTTVPGPVEEPLDPEGFYLMLMWHQHQPLYPKDENGVVTRPWVRVHATKDYYDMAALVEEFPELRVTFNLTPVLMLQLEELANGTKDVYWTLTEVPADQLDEEQRAFVLSRFFDANPKVIARFPRYQELADQRGGEFSEQDLRDLQVLFNLGWTDPSFLAEEPLASLVSKGRDFTEEDKQVVLDEHLRIVREVLPIHARLWEEGQIEVTTTPLAHPILPLITDTNLATVGDSAALLPSAPFQEPLDAADHVRLGLDEAERLLGRRPVGMWPGEGAVAQRVLSLFSREGVRWIATGEDVLAASLGLGDFTRDGQDTVAEAETLYQPWLGVPSRNPEVAIFFRDLVISDQPAFQYSGTTAEAAAADFMARLERIKDRLESSGADGPHVVSVILDGENAWEHYPNDGIDHLRAIYQALSESEWVRTVTPSQYLDAFGDQLQGLDEVFPGAWFSANYATWIGEEEEATAWDYLRQVRGDFADISASGDVLQTMVDAAYRTMLFAEGSDWFWWYGADQDSGDDGYFDRAFRELLGQVYDALGVPRPDFVSVPIIPEAPVLASTTPEGSVTITVDNDVSDAEWAGGGVFVEAAEDPGLIRAIHYGFDATNLYLRVDFSRELLGEATAGFDLYLSAPPGGQKRAVSLGSTLLGFGATSMVRWSAADPVSITRTAELPRLGGAAPTFGDPEPAGFDGNSVEFAIPIADLGAIETGDRILARAVEIDNLEAGVAPDDGPALIQVPDISNVDIVFESTDPTGDDHGPGSYTYPLDAVFVPGSYDLTSFSVGTSGEDVVFTFEVDAAVRNPWGSPNGLSIQTFDVYVDTDPGAGTGARLLIPGRNAAMPETFGWEYGITLEGWEPAIYVADAGGTFEETRPTFKIIVLADRGRVIARVPASLLGDGDPAQWAYAVAVMSQEGFPSGGVRRVRDVLPNAEQWRVGGGPAGVNHTRILDALSPEPGVQEQSLSDYTGVTGGGVDTLGPDDFGTIPVIQPG